VHGLCVVAVQLCVVMCGCVRLCAVVCGCVQLRVFPRRSAWLSVWLRVVVCGACSCVYFHAGVPGCLCGCVWLCPVARVVVCVVARGVCVLVRWCLRLCVRLRVIAPDSVLLRAVACVWLCVLRFAHRWVVHVGLRGQRVVCACGCVVAGLMWHVVACGRLWLPGCADSVWERYLARLPMWWRVVQYMCSRVIV
jgi:hypothetical protein